MDSGLALVVARSHPDLLPATAECREVFALAEEVGYSPYEAFRISGEKPAALRILGVKQPEAAVRMALARLRDPDTPDIEQYVPVVAAFGRGDSVTMLLDTVRLDPPTRVVQAVGRELGRLDSEVTVPSVDESSQRRPTIRGLSSCEVSPFTEKLDAKVRARADDADKRLGSSLAKSRSNVSALGMPLGSARTAKEDFLGPAVLREGIP